MKLRNLSLLATLIVFIAAPVSAESITYEIDAYLTGYDFDGGPVNGFQENIGYATFEGPVDNGNVVLADMEIQILDQIFTEDDDDLFPDAPTGTISDGELVAMQFEGSNDQGAYLRVNQSLVFSVQWSSNGHWLLGQATFRPTSTSGTSGGGVGAMPEPSAALVFAAGLAIVGYRRR